MKLREEASLTIYGCLQVSYILDYQDLLHSVFLGLDYQVDVEKGFKKIFVLLLASLLRSS